jgi:glycosyltransferase involved in cell wall biosynthesis
VPPGDARAIADAASTLLQDRALATRLGAAARRRIATEFSVDRMVRATEQLYVELLIRKGKAVARRTPTAAA